MISKYRKQLLSHFIVSTNNIILIVNWLYNIIHIPFHKRHIIWKKDCIYWFPALGIHLIPCSHLHSNQVDENAVFDPLLHLHPSFRLMDVISMHIWRLIIISHSRSNTTPFYPNWYQNLSSHEYNLTHSVCLLLRYNETLKVE